MGAQEPTFNDPITKVPFYGRVRTGQVFNDTYVGIQQSTKVSYMNKLFIFFCTVITSENLIKSKIPHKGDVDI